MPSCKYKPDWLIDKINPLLETICNYYTITTNFTIIYLGNIINFQNKDVDKFKKKNKKD